MGFDCKADWYTCFSFLIFEILRTFFRKISKIRSSRYAADQLPESADQCKIFAAVSRMIFDSGKTEGRKISCGTDRASYWQDMTTEAL